MGRPKECNPCCGRQRSISSPGYCTHRRYDETGTEGNLVWSRNINPSQRLLAAVFAMAVGDDGNVYSAGTLNQITNPNGVVEARDADGAFLWRTGIEARLESITFSGGAVWVVGSKVGGEGTADNIFKLDPADGSILWRGHLTVGGVGGHITRPHVVISDGGSGVYVGGGSSSDGASGFVARLNPSGSKLSEWTVGVNDDSTTGSVSGLALRDGFIYVSGLFTGADECRSIVTPWRGPLIKLTTSYERIWIRTSYVSLGPGIESDFTGVAAYDGTLGPGVAVAATGGAVYVAFKSGCIWKVDPDTAEVLESKRATGTELGGSCGGINGMAASTDGSTIYVANGQHLVAHDAGDLSVAWCEKHAGIADDEEVSCCYYAVASGSGGEYTGDRVYVGGCAAGCDPESVEYPASCSSTTCIKPECACGSIGPFGGTIVNCDCEEVPCSHRFPIVSTCSALNGGWIDWNRDVNNSLKWKGLVFAAGGAGTGEYFDVTYDCNSEVNGGWSITGSSGISDLVISSWWCTDGAPAGSSFPGFAGTFTINWGQERCEDVCLVFGTGACPAPSDTVEFCGCENVPTTLHGDFTLGTFSQTIDLTYDDSIPAYLGTLICGSCTLSVTLYCDGGAGGIIISPQSGPGECSECGATTGGAAISCSPFEVSFSVAPATAATCNMACGDGSTWVVDIYE